MNNIRSKTFVLGFLITLAIVVMIVIENQTKVGRRLYDDIVFDNKNHYLPCTKLPSVEEVTSVIEQHKDVIAQIEQVNPGQVGVEVDLSSCRGKADIVIWYASHDNRLKIEQIINNETFFGIPYRLQNR